MTEAASTTPSCQRISETKRSCHVTSILPISREDGGNRMVEAFRLYLEAAAFLALKHLNTRNGSVLPQLPSRLEGCDIEFTYELRDTRFQERYAATEFLEALTNPDRVPFAILGAARSAVSQVLGVLTSTFDIPQISPTSSSPILNDKLRYPSVTRTQTSTDTDARACAHYLSSLGVTHVGVLYRQDVFASSYAVELAQEARRLGMTAVTWGFREDSIGRAVQELKALDYRYIVGIFTQDVWRQVILEASKANIIGVPTHSWIFSSANVDFVDGRFELEDEDLAMAIHGSGVLVPNRLPSAPLDMALRNFAQNETLQTEFKSLHAESSLLESFEFTDAPPGASVFFYQLAYDAMVALGLAACSSETDLFTSIEFLETLKATEFSGASGEVKFDPLTGSRSADGLSFRIENVVISSFENNTYRFTANTAVEIQIPEVKMIQPYIYQDSTMIPPNPLPPVEEEMNLISPALLGVGLTLGLLTILASLGWAIWTYVFRTSPAVKSSQPIFLYQICIGTFIMGCAVLPLAAQEPLNQSTLDAACMATPWLISIGWVIAFSALFTKTWRLNKLFKSGERFRRILVKPRDVVAPFVGFMVFNVTFLISWSAVAPLRWTRIQRTNFDRFGRNTESWGTCYGGDSNISPLIFFIPLLSVNVLALAVTCYQSYLSRTVPTEFSESNFINVSMACTLETILLASPLLILVAESPGPKFLVQSVLILFLCMSILVPIFAPKELKRADYWSVRALTSGRFFSLSEYFRQKRTGSAAGSQILMNLNSSSRRASTRLSTRFNSGQLSAMNLFDNLDEEDSSPVEDGSMKVNRKIEYYAQRSQKIKKDMDEEKAKSARKLEVEKEEEEEADWNDKESNASDVWK